MAQLKGSALGNLSGRLGNLVARIVAGRTILAIMPSSYTVNQSPHLVEIRRKFTCSVSFAKAVITLSALKEIWRGVKESGMSVFNYVVKNNFALISADKPTTGNIITPGGFAPPVQSANVEPENVAIELVALNTVSVFTPEEKNLSANGLICYYNPSDPADKPFAITTINAELAHYDVTAPYTLNIPLNVLQQAMAGKYSNSILYFTVASKTDDGIIVQYSATYSLDK
jgi:hypothetical protein